MTSLCNAPAEGADPFRAVALRDEHRRRLEAAQSRYEKSRRCGLVGSRVACLPPGWTEVNDAMEAKAYADLSFSDRIHTAACAICDHDFEQAAIEMAKAREWLEMTRARAHEVGAAMQKVDDRFQVKSNGALDDEAHANRAAIAAVLDSVCACAVTHTLLLAQDQQSVAQSLA